MNPGASRRLMPVLALLLLIAAPYRVPARVPPGIDQALDVALSEARQGGAKVAAIAIDVDNGDVWYEREADQSLNVASNAKLVTAAALLSRLPATTTFPTEVYGTLGEDGVVSGDLLFRGRGNPRLASEDVAAMADDLKKLGVRSITGGVAVDDSAFDDHVLPPVYDQKDTDEGYRSAVGALSIDYNAVAVVFKPGKGTGSPPRVSVRPDGDDVDFVNRATTVAGKTEELKVHAEPGADGRTRVTVTGTIGIGNKGGLVRRRIAEPGMHAGYVFREALERRGIKVGREAVVRARAPEGAKPLLSRPSPPLADLVKDCIQWSNNNMAETFLKHLGAAEGGPPGTFEAGVTAVTAFLTRVGLKAGAYVYKNGSGLYDADFFSPRQMAKVLRHAWSDEALRKPFVASMAVAGKSGTLRGRMKKGPAAGKVMAKTGTLDNVITLSGYIRTHGGRTVAFSILMNDLKVAPAVARRAQDRFCEVIAKQ